MLRKRALLVDNGFSARPIFKSLRQKNYEVYVVGSGGTRLQSGQSANYFNRDYSDTSSIESLASELGVDFLVPGVTDVSYATCAALNKNDSYPGIDCLEVTHTLNNKQAFRDLCIKLGLPSPRILDGDYQQFGKKLIVKPVDGYSGKGISIVRPGNDEDLWKGIAAAQDASKSAHYIVEEFIDGQLYSHSCFLMSGEVIHDVIVEEHSVSDPFAVDTSYVVTDFPEKYRVDLREIVSAIARQLSLVDGLFHTQFKLCERGIFLIEVTRRCPGDLYSELVHLSTGFPYAMVYSQGFTGELTANINHSGQARRIIRYTLKSSDPCNFESVKFHKPLEICQFHPIESCAFELSQPRHDGRIAIMFTSSENRQAQADQLQTALAGVIYSA